MKPTRASFIRSVPISMPVEEVIERAREAGLDLQPSDIHAARYYMRQAATGSPSPKRTIVQPRIRDTASEANGAANATHDANDAKESREPQQKVIESFFTVRSVDANGKTSPSQARSGREAPARSARVTRDYTETTTPARKTRGKRAVPIQTTLDDSESEEQLRQLIVRLGSARTREIIDEAEALALTVLDED